MNIYISVIVPCYKCAPFIEELVQRAELVLKSNFEIIFVNDCSPLNDWKIIKKLCQSKPYVKGINLSRNFGQHYAINAGLNYASGQWVVVMDGDLQDQPEAITDLMAKAEEGYDIVFAKRGDRQDNYFKRLSSKYFYRVLSYLTETEQNEQIANFGLYNRKVVDAILSMNDAVKYFPTMVQWVGFNKSAVVVEHAKRINGKSGYSFKTLLTLALNVILSFSNKPLRLVVRLGLYISVISVFAIIYFLVQYLRGQIDVLGYSSLIISIWMFSGLIITLIGMVGLYIGKIFDQVKERPVYIIDEKINIK